MADAPITDETSRTLRALWFAYLDTVEPIRTPLHAYGLRLTGNLWDAEDLVQDTLLKGFAMIGRGDLHGERSPVENARAYLFRTATNLWIDAERRRSRERGTPAAPATAAAADPSAVRAAGERLFAAASPQARAAVVLKDVFGFSLEEIADQLRTTPGAVKAALSRGREALQAEPRTRPGPPRALIDRFVDAYNAHDVGRLIAVLTETVSIEVLGVGGGRAIDENDAWTHWAVTRPLRAEVAHVAGEDVVLVVHEGGPEPVLCEVLRLDGDETRVSRIIDYCYARDTLAQVAAAVGRTPMPLGYHQDPDTLTAMVASTTLPWRRA